MYKMCYKVSGKSVTSHLLVRHQRLEVKRMVVRALHTAVRVISDACMLMTVLEIQSPIYFLRIRVLHQMTQIVVAAVLFPSTHVRVRPDGPVSRWCGLCGFHRGRSVHSIASASLAEQVQTQQKQKDKKEEKERYHSFPDPGWTIVWENSCEKQQPYNISVLTCNQALLFPVEVGGRK